jgi:hypothetical protein
MIAHAVAMLYRSGEHIGDSLDAPVRMPRKPSQIVLGNIIPKIIEQQERVELIRGSETERSSEVHASPFQGWLGFYDTLNLSDRHDILQFTNFVLVEKPKSPFSRSHQVIS